MAADQNTTPPIEVEARPYDEPESVGPPYRDATYAYYASPEPSCCSGCGCMVAGLLLILILMPGKLVSAVIMVLAAAWLSVVLLRLFRISRYSPAYVYVLVPLFLAVVSMLGYLIRGKAPYDAREIVVGTLVIYATLFAADLVSRRRRLR